MKEILFFPCCKYVNHLDLEKYHIYKTFCYSRCKKCKIAVQWVKHKTTKIQK